MKKEEFKCQFGEDEVKDLLETEQSVTHGYDISDKNLKKKATK